MTSRRRLACAAIAILALAAASLPAAAAADETLDPNQSLFDYLESLRADAKDATRLAQASAESTTAALAAANSKAATGLHEKTTSVAPPTEVEDGATATTDDYLSWIQAALTGNSGGSDRKGLTLKFNPLRHGRYGQLAIATTFAAQPKPYQPLLAQVVDSARSAQQAAIEKDLQAFGDVAIAATYSFDFHDDSAGLDATHRMWGRDWGRYAPLVDELVHRGVRCEVEAIARGEKTAAAQAADAEYAAIIGRYVDLDAGPISLKTLKWGQFHADDAARLAQALRRHALFIDHVEQEMSSWKLDTLAALINNQPQLTLTGHYHALKDLAGPDAYGLTLRFEMGTHNFNTFLKKLRSAKACASPGTAGGNAGQRDAIAAFKEVVAQQAKVRHEDRFVFSATWEKTDSLSISYPYTTTVSDGMGGTTMTSQVAQASAPGSHSLVASLDWSRTLETKKDGEARPVFDLSLAYDDVSGDKMRQDRLIGKAGFTIGFANGMSVPLTLVYANHGRYLGDVDQQLSAHFGVVYKFGDKPQAEKESSSAGGGSSHGSS